MITTTIDLTGLDALQRELRFVFDVLNGGELGRVYHEGAYGSSRQRYEALVQKKGEQAAIHQGYWHTDRDVVDRRESEVRRVFEGLVSSIATGRRVDLRRASEEALKLIYDDLRRYPPPRAGSSYIRTGRLAAGWRWVVT